MNLISNIANVAFETRYNIDKIVGVWEGSYNRATQVTTRTYTLLGLPYDVFFYRIAHGFSRPIFCDLLWSKDNVTYSDGGAGSTGGDVSIAFSDSTYIYIYDAQGAASSGMAYYKVIGFWITDYDLTNPLVPAYSSANKTINFDSRLNYQKIYMEDVSNFSFTSGVLSEPSNPITHGLSKRPNFRVFFESFSGEVWPMHYGGASNVFLFDDTQLECKAVMNNTSLVISQLHAASSTRTSSRAWYRIYLDT